MERPLGRKRKKALKVELWWELVCPDALSTVPVPCPQEAMDHLRHTGATVVPVLRMGKRLTGYSDFPLVVENRQLIEMLRAAGAR